MMDTPSVRNRIGLYLVLTFSFSSVFYFLIIRQGAMHVPGTLPYTLFLMWSPGIAATLVTFFSQKNLRGLGWSWGRTSWQALSYTLPLLYALVAYGFVWFTGLGGFPNPDFIDHAATQIREIFGWSDLSPTAIIAAAVLIDGTVGFLVSCVSAMGEEIGWRGFLVPHLSKITSFSKTALISGGIWSIYHYPLLIFSDYNSGAPTWYSMACFTLLVLAVSFPFAWLRLKSGSLWTGVILHASHNLFVQAVFDRITVDTGTTRYFTGEFGIALAVVSSAVAYYFWKRRTEVEQSNTPELTVK